MVEKNFYPLFKHWLEKNKPGEFWFFEIKLFKGNRFRLNSVSQRQIDWLLSAQKGAYYKITDTTALNGFTQPKPCDGFWTGSNQVSCFIIPIFYIPRKKKIAYLIPVKEFLKLSGKSVKEEELSGFVSIEL